MEQKREYGFYYVRMFKGDEWTIGQYKGDFMRGGKELNGWLLIGEEARWSTSELYEIGERIPSDDDLKEIKILLNDSASTCYGEDQKTYNKIVSITEKLGWLPK